MPAKVVALEQICELYHIPTQVLINVEIVLIAKWDWHICIVRSVIRKLKTSAKDAPVHLKIDHILAEDAALR